MRTIITIILLALCLSATAHAAGVQIATDDEQTQITKLSNAVGRFVFLTRQLMETGTTGEERGKAHARYERLEESWRAMTAARHVSDAAYLQALDDFEREQGRIIAELQRKHKP